VVSDKEAFIQAWDEFGDLVEEKCMCDECIALRKIVDRILKEYDDENTSD